MKKTKARQGRRRVGRAGLGVMGALLAAPLVGASQQRDEEPQRSLAADFPFTTLSRTQSVRLNASNVTANPPDPDADPHDPDRQAPTCRVLFRLFDGEGRVVASATRALRPGVSRSIVFANPADPDMPAGRTGAGAVEGVRGEIATQAGRCGDALIGSMEIVDTRSGEVRAILAPAGKLRATQVTIKSADPDAEENN